VKPGLAYESALLRDGVRLAVTDFGGHGPPVLLLHGLAGSAGEWTETAAWLTERARVIAPDARGHGDSERVPSDVSREAHVADAVFVAEQLDLGPLVVVGQSLGGLTALLLASRHARLVRGLVLVEAGPRGGDRSANEAHVAELGEALRRWPVPFASREAATEFFGRRSPAGETWAAGLECRDGGFWPRFDVDVLTRTLLEAGRRSYWEDWERVACPALVVRGGAGTLPPADADAMVASGHDVRLVEVAHAGHDVHLERPREWRHVLSEFLDSLE
jgi:pimeloyl-ACP methyl ester carboxylesterase